MKKLSKLLTLIAAFIFCLTLTACGGSTKLNLADYLSLDVSGVDSNGRASLSFDAAQMELDFAGVKNGSPNQEELEKMLSLAQFELSVQYNLDKADGLSNGDKITATVTYNEDLAKEAKVSIGSTTKTFTVEGLAEPVMVDPFDEAVFGQGKAISYTFEGTAPFGFISLDKAAGSENPISFVDYAADKGYNSTDLSNGDVVTFTASIDEKYANQGYVLTRAETTITVEGLDKYATSAADLTPDFLRTVSDRAYQECVAQNDVNIYDGSNNLTPWNASFENIHVGNSALLMVKNDHDEYNYNFLLVPVYKTLSTDEWYNMDTMQNESKTWSDVVAYYTFSNVIVHTDGSVTYDESYVEANGSYTDSTVADNLFLNQFAAEYSSTEVPMPTDAE